MRRSEALHLVWEACVNTQGADSPEMEQALRIVWTMHLEELEIEPEVDKLMKGPTVVATRCEDYPCCAHGPAPLGDSGGCPVQYSDGSERWPCAHCRQIMPVGQRSALCDACVAHVRRCSAEGIEPWPDEG